MAWFYKLLAQISALVRACSGFTWRFSECDELSGGNAPNLTTESRFHLPENAHKEIL